MKFHPVVVSLNGVVTVQLQAQFIGDSTDATDKTYIQGYGDPQVNLAGNFSDGATPTPFTFATASQSQYVGLTTAMQGQTARFMTQLPPAQPGQPLPVAGPLDVITANPAKAAQVWTEAIQARCAAAMVALRALPAPLSTLSDTTI